MQYSRMHSLLALEAMMAGITGAKNEQIVELEQKFPHPEDRMREFTKGFNFNSPERAATFAVALTLLVRDALEFFNVSPHRQAEVGQFVFEVANASFPDTLGIKRELERRLVDTKGREIKLL